MDSGLGGSPEMPNTNACRSFLTWQMRLPTTSCSLLAKADGHHHARSFPGLMADAAGSVEHRSGGSNPFKRGNPFLARRVELFHSFPRRSCDRRPHSRSPLPFIESKVFSGKTGRRLVLTSHTREKTGICTRSHANCGLHRFLRSTSPRPYQSRFKRTHTEKCGTAGAVPLSVASTLKS